MNGSVTLSQLPYTGFDYGEAYNSGFWVALTLWSLMLSIIIVRHRASWTRGFAGLASPLGAGTSQENATHVEPVILAERITPTSERVAEGSGGTWSSEYAPEVSEETKHRVRELVEQELAESREGQTPEEFSSEDFASVDFDGVNPDEYWEPRQYAAPAKEGERVAQMSPTQQESIPNPAIPQHEQRVVPRVRLQDTLYTDEVALDKSGEYPKLVLTRSEKA